MLAMLFGCGFRRSELVGMELDEIQTRQGHWAAVDLRGLREDKLKSIRSTAQFLAKDAA
jgi:site-specific recombinase XerD